MAATYKAIGWNRHKIVYDLAVLAGIALFVGIYVVLAPMLNPAAANTSPEIVAISALGGCAFTLLHIVLAIGPLARLSPVFLPLLYNRRHLGVIVFLLALAHGAFAIVWYHGFADVDPVTSIFMHAGDYRGIGGFPFEVLGMGALLVLFVMAATSHDFWLNNLSPAVWKTLHMLVYAAYAVLVAHVLLGAARESGQPGLYAVAVLGGFAMIAALHLAAGVKAWRQDRETDRLVRDGWMEVGPYAAIPENRARIISPPGGEKIAVFRYDGKVSAVSNVCRHQMGPLGEGKVVDGCITCPWHGWQYRPDTGRSPPPYLETVATYRTKMVGSNVYVDPRPCAKDAPAQPSQIAGAAP
jgi:nitrite reductase/ring-hydroxylating ferredoxin subunit/DMSO/TMAO reductase YedYZ heme-binding membrane subunit